MDPGTQALLTFGALIFGACLFALACAADYAAVNGRRRESCSACSGRISPKYAAVTAAGAVLAPLLAWGFGFTADTLVRFLFITVLAAVALIDLDTMEIPDWLCLAAAAVGLVSYFTGRDPGWVSRLIGVFCVSVPLTVITLLIPGAFGGGDIKLIAACGVLLGWKSTLLAAFLAILLGGVWGAWLLITKKKKGSEHFAFGPFLCAGCAVCAFYGGEAARLFLQIFDFSRFF